MTNGINKVILIGYAGQETELKITTRGDSFTIVSLATKESWKNKETGERDEKTQWHRVVFYRKQAEFAASYIKKGSLCYIEGSINYKKYTNKEGVEKSVSEIIASEFRVLSSRSIDIDELSEQEIVAMKAESRTENKMTFEDDIPF